VSRCSSGGNSLPLWLQRSGRSFSDGLFQR
jgi:hypothetical protein